MQGVIDRIEDGIAVILIEAEHKEWKVSVEALPEGSREGSVLHLEASGDHFNILSLDEEATAFTTDKANLLQKKLQAKKKRSKFKRRE